MAEAPMGLATGPAKKLTKATEAVEVAAPVGK